MFKIHSDQFLKDKSHLLNLFTLRFSIPPGGGWAAGRLSRLRQPLTRLPVSLAQSISRNDQPSDRSQISHFRSRPSVLLWKISLCDHSHPELI